MKKLDIIKNYRSEIEILILSNLRNLSNIFYTINFK
ncbi:hypothetical protein LCGC14_0660010 [marine sediment metagenome]|uniref:Uncharacterized protein n=1 Tax=marine sediment metagenome TaxID=412755 RepID=A0A0F9RDU1_9ZZZZ